LSVGNPKRGADEFDGVGATFAYVIGLFEFAQRNATHDERPKGAELLLFAVVASLVGFYHSVKETLRLFAREALGWDHGAFVFGVGWFFVFRHRFS
jgi:hypothetical protein